MRWTERQRAMLREMGVRTWARGGPVLESAASRDEKIVADDESPAEPVRPTLATAPRPAAPAVPAPGDIEWMPADWLIVGEPFDAVANAPGGLAAGEQERLLANMLQAIGVSRDAPTRAGRACHIALDEGTRRALDTALECARPRLALALGRAAAEALLGVDEPLGRLRGKVHERAGTRVVVTFPLAYLLRNPTEKAKAWSDLCLAVRALEAG